MNEIVAQAADGVVSIQTVLTIVGAAGSALVATVIALWKQFHTTVVDTKKEITKRWEDCEEKHDQANTHLIELSSKVGVMEGKIKTYEGVNSRLEQLTEAVLEQVQNDGPKGS